MAVTLKNIIFWDIMPCSRAKIYEHFKGTWCFHLQGQRLSQAEVALLCWLGLWLLRHSKCHPNLTSILPDVILRHLHVVGSTSIPWLRLALCKGPNWVGVFSPSPSPGDGNRSSFQNIISTPKRTRQWEKSKKLVILWTCTVNPRFNGLIEDKGCLLDRKFVKSPIF
jgi:hypothetical protein